jgi:uncharacterized protein YwqG
MAGDLSELEVFLSLCQDAELADALRKIARPAIRLEMEIDRREVPLGASFFGGAPDLPSAWEWPALDGVPMEFVAQLDLPQLSVPELPNSGHLWFFYDWEQSCSPQDPERLGRVLFSDSQDLTRREPLENACTLLAISPASEAVLTLPGYDEAVRFLPPALLTRYQQTYRAALDPERAWPEMGRIFGYAIDEDTEHQIPSDQQFLLQVPSNLGEYSWGPDNEPLHYVISPADLAARRFEAVRTVMSLLRA